MGLGNKKIFRYLETFGVFHGLRIFYLLRRSKRKVVSIKLPGLKNKITIRKQESDFVVFEEIFIDQIYRIKAMQPLDVIIDAGANTGLASLYFLIRYKPKTLICIEPNETNYQLLEHNLGGYDNIILYKKALWSSNTHLKFKDSTAASWAFEVIEASVGEKDTVEAISLNDLVNSHEIKRINLLKIDIEGSEKEVFESGNEWGKITKNLIVEVHENMRPGAQSAVDTLTSRYMELESKSNDNYIYRSIHLS